MHDGRSANELTKAGAGRQAPDRSPFSIREAFSAFGLVALWNRKPRPHPTIVVAESLRREGNMKSRPPGVKIEEAFRAAL